MIITLLLLLSLLSPPRVAIALPASQKLVVAWQAKERGVACLFGHSEVYKGDDMIVIDSVQITNGCSSPAIGIFGFIYDSEDKKDEVLEAMSKVIHNHPGMQIAGQVHALDRLVNEGHWITAPRVWWSVKHSKSSNSTEKKV